MSRWMLSLPIVAVLSLFSSAHTGIPPSLPEISETAPDTVSVSATNCDVIGTSWCLYSVASVLRCKKNGSYVSLTFNSVTTSSPHQYHIDKTFNVKLTTLGLQTGDVLVWEFTAAAMSGPSTGVPVTTTATTLVN